ncbi:unnamed protein product [Trichobilharzia szidati]|nr:unnamed protein product [Trichobilharzia szidati]
MASEEASNSIRKPSARRSKPDMAALVDQQRFFDDPWSRNSLYQLDSLIPVVALHDLGKNGINIRHFSPSASSHSEKRFHKHPPLSCSSSGDSDIGESNTNSVIEVDEGGDDDDLPLSTFLPLKSVSLSNTMINNNNSDNSITINSSDNSLNTSISSNDSNNNDNNNNSTTTNNNSCIIINNDNNTSDNINNHKIVHSSCQCTKPAVVDDPRWDGEYCSPECLIRVCHEAFQSWLENHHGV